MKISTKGRYALRVMIDLAEHNSGELITLAEIAERQELSEKYLEGIVAVLSKNGLLTAVRGKGGGYRLAKAPSEYTVGNILKLTEGSLAPVSCVEKEGVPCVRAEKCRTIGMWRRLDSLIQGFLEGVTLADLLKTDEEE